MRGLAAGLLAVVGLALVPLADAGVWTRRQLLATAPFVDLAVEVLERPEVRDALAARLTDEVSRRAGLRQGSEPVVRSAVERALTTRAFEELFRAAAGGLHEQFERGDDALVLRPDRALPLIEEQAAAIDQAVAEQIPGAGLSGITVVTEEDVPELWRAVDAVRQASLLFPAASVVVLAAALAAARRRTTMLAVLGAGVFVIAVALALVLELGRNALSEVSGPALRVEAFVAGYDVVIGSFVAQTALFAAGGVAAMVVGAALGWRARRNRRPTVWA